MVTCLGQRRDDMAELVGCLGEAVDEEDSAFGCRASRCAGDVVEADFGRGA